MNKYFTADPHFGHTRILELLGRPFKTIEEHDEHLLNNINKIVPAKGSILYMLGDFTFKDYEKYRKRIRCEDVRFIIGNHDPERFEGVWPHAIEIRFGDANHAWLAHYPHYTWPRSHYGSYHFYGHCHTMREYTLDTMFPDRRSMDVGVDAAKFLLGEFQPFSEGQLLSILQNRTGHDPVEFYRGVKVHGKT